MNRFFTYRSERADAGVPVAAPAAAATGVGAEGCTLHLPTLEQAVAVRNALDLYMRMSLGQISELAYLVRVNEIQPRESPSCHQHELAMIDRIDALTQQIAIELGHTHGSSHGVGSPRVSMTGCCCATPARQRHPLRS